MFSVSLLLVEEVPQAMEKLMKVMERLSFACKPINKK